MCRGLVLEIWSAVFARLYAAKAREEALELNCAGQFEEAQNLLQAALAPRSFAVIVVFLIFIFVMNP